MAKNDFKKEDQNLENVQESMSAVGLWIEENQKMLIAVVAVIAVVVGGWVAINSFVIAPKRQAASNENAKVMTVFQQGDYAKALEGFDTKDPETGDDVHVNGFEQIAAEYGSLQEGKLAALYAGICHYQMGDFEQAASYLQKFDAEDLNVAPAANQLLGDAYVQLEEYDKAVAAFEAAAKSGNEIIAPMSLKKAGLVYLEQGKNKQAKKVFETIKSDYPASQEAQDIDRFIALAE